MTACIIYGATLKTLYQPIPILPVSVHPRQTFEYEPARDMSHRSSDGLRRDSDDSVRFVA